MFASIRKDMNLHGIPAAKLLDIILVIWYRYILHAEPMFDQLWKTYFLKKWTTYSF